MESVFEAIQQFWSGFQQGQLPDLGTWNYMLVAVFMMFQGRASALLGGAAAAAGYLNLLPIILIALLARLIVDLFWYNVGATGHLNRIGRRIGALEGVAQRVEDGIRLRPQRFILIAKLSNGLSLPAVITAGSTHVPYRRWLPASFGGELLWTLPLLLMGYLTTDALAKFEGSLSYLTIGLSFLFLFGFLIFPLRSRFASARKQS